jgi:hypothetical protein
LRYFFVFLFVQHHLFFWLQFFLISISFAAIFFIFVNVFFIFIVCNTLYSFYCVFVAFYLHYRFFTTFSFCFNFHIHFIIGCFISRFLFFGFVTLWVWFIEFYFHLLFLFSIQAFIVSLLDHCSLQCKFVLFSSSLMDDIQLFVLVYFVTYIELFQNFL